MLQCPRYPQALWIMSLLSHRFWGNVNALTEDLNYVWALTSVARGTTMAKQNCAPAVRLCTDFEASLCNKYFVNFWTWLAL